MLIRQVALVSEISAISISALTRVSAALQKQAARDLGPLWGVQATVDPFANLDDVPAGYWPIIVREDIQMEGAAGVHMDENGQPFALVQYDSSWSLTASHECMEMLVDPFGNRLVAGNSAKKGQGRVEYLVEVCDPSESAAFSYSVNGVQVSDFYTPRYFDPVKSTAVRYSYTGAIKSPRDVLRDGYLSWHEPASNHWWQLTYFNGRKRYRDLGVLAKSSESLRERIDRLIPASLRGARQSIVMMPTPKTGSWRRQVEAQLRAA